MFDEYSKQKQQVLHFWKTGHNIYSKMSKTVLCRDSKKNRIFVDRIDQLVFSSSSFYVHYERCLQAVVWWSESRQTVVSRQVQLLKKYLLVPNSPPTEHFPILYPQNLSIDGSHDKRLFNQRILRFSKYELLRGAAKRREESRRKRLLSAYQRVYFFPLLLFCHICQMLSFPSVPERDRQTYELTYTHGYTRTDELTNRHSIHTDWWLDRHSNLDCWCFCHQKGKTSQVVIAIPTTFGLISHQFG